VLLVDDHPEVLRSLKRMLASHVDVVAAATNAEEALDAARSLDPDIVVLDITMPRRDGFQVAQDLADQGSRAQIVFLTMHESAEFVAQAFRSGGRGYVLKTRLHMDLITALECVLAGQLFLPSLRSLLTLDDHAAGHVLQFHPDDQALVDSVGGFLNVALRGGDAVSVVLTEPHRAGIARRLQAYGWKVGESGVFGRYRAADPADSLAFVMQNGRTDSDRVRQLVEQLEQWRASVAEGPNTRLTVVGSIAEQLVLEGNTIAAMELETQWSALTKDLPILTVCCYSMTSFADDPQMPALSHVCAEHFAIAHAQEGGQRSLSM
jgi:two-component system nitrate/nitrite response regulator NarL